jgi:MerR family transcriptional regulator, light-induced transcriptional regulator
MAYTIKELESLTGIKAHTIRIWEQRYHFIKPSRTQTNIRTYNNEELKTLLTVALLNKYGYKISKIDDMPHEERLQVALQLPDTDAQVENTVNELIGCMVDLESIRFEEILNRHIREKGLEHTITTLVFQFLEKVGILWQTNKILPVQEHIVSGIIRQKIVSAIEGLPFVRREDPLFILFLPEEEHHEMGLLFVYYLLRKSGIPVIYLGANVPIGDLPYLVELKKPRYLYMHLTAFTRQPALQKFFARLSAMAPDATILASGSVIQYYGKKLPLNVKPLVTLQEVLGFVKLLPAGS